MQCTSNSVKGHVIKASSVPNIFNREVAPIIIFPEFLYLLNQLSDISILQCLGLPLFTAFAASFFASWLPSFFTSFILQIRFTVAVETPVTWLVFFMLKCNSFRRTRMCLRKDSSYFFLKTILSLDRCVVNIEMVTIDNYQALSTSYTYTTVWKKARASSHWDYFF